MRKIARKKIGSDVPINLEKKYFINRKKKIKLIKTNKKI